MFLCNSAVNVSTSLLLYIGNILLFLHLSLYSQFPHYKPKPYYPVFLVKISKMYTQFSPLVSLHIPLSNQISLVCHCLYLLLYLCIITFSLKFDLEPFKPPAL